MRSLNDCPFRYQGSMRIVRQACITIDSATTHPMKGCISLPRPDRVCGNNPTLYGYVYDPNS